MKKFVLRNFFDMDKINLVSSLIITGFLPVFSITVSLDGKVTNNAGSGIFGALVGLAGENSLSSITDDRGVFSIKGEFGVAADLRFLSRPSLPRFNLSGNKLIIDPAPSYEHNRIDIFSGNGRSIASVKFSGNKSEKQTIVLPNFIPGINIIKISIGNETFTQLLFRAGNSIYRLSNDVFGISSDFTTIKNSSAAAVDTLIVSKSGYISVKKPIDSYEKQGIVIIMQEEQSIGEMPLVYDKEFTGEDCPKPKLVDNPTTLPPIEYLPDPFLMADGKNRMTAMSQWRCRRAEILETVMKYGIGHKPPKPENFQASLSGNTIKITVGVGGNVINMSATISRPSSTPKDKPIPAIINKGSLQFDFASKGIAVISYKESDVVNNFFGGGFKEGNFYKIYPNTDAGYMVRAAWLISRIIDALEMLPEAYIDTKRLAVSGCSYGGKIALYSGALDERIALTIPHESGGGGTVSWRYAEILDQPNNEVEDLNHAQGAAWYSDALRVYQPENVSPNTLPYDQHEVMALCLPRALFCIESSMIYRMGAEAARVSALATRKTYSAFGIGDRFGVTEANVNHCTWSNTYTPDLEAFVDKFLLGKETNTNILRSKFTNIDTAKWIPWSAPDLK